MSTELSGPVRGAWRTVLSFLAYAGLTIIMTWPLAAHLSSQLAGARTDLWIHQWTFWWIKEAVQNGENPFYTTLLYYPQGVSLTSHNIAWFNIALWLPLQTFLGAVTAYNLVFMLVLALNGFAFYLFAKLETGAPLPAFLGGIIFGFWPYTLSHYDHPNMMVTFWLPLTLIFLRRTYENGRLLDALLAAASLAMVGITRWQLLVMSAPILIIYVLYLFYRTPQGRTTRAALMLLGATILAGLLMAPLGAPLVLDQLGRSGPEAVSVEEPDAAVTDLFAYVAPPDLYRRIWNERPQPLPYPEWEPYHRIAASAYYVPFVGLATLIVGIYGLWRQWPNTWIWLLVALVIMLLALGPELAVNGQRYPQAPMPYQLLQGTLLDALIRRPHRLNNFLGLPVAMIAVWGMLDLFARLGDRSSGRWLVPVSAILLGALILRAAPIPPLPLTNTPVPLWYRQLAGEEGPVAILELPFHNRGFDKLYMYYQTAHGKPIMVGHVSRLPQEAFAFIDSVPFLRPFKSIYTWNVVDESWVDFGQVDVTRQLGLLDAAGVRYIVLNKPLIAPGFVERWRDWVTFRPHYEDEEVLVYRTRPQHGEEFVIEQPLTGELGLLRGGFAPEAANQKGVIKVDLRWASSAAPQTDYEVCVALRGGQGGAGVRSCKEPAAGWPTSHWGRNAVARGVYVIPLPEEMAPGTYDVEVTLVDAASGLPVGQTAVLGQATVASVAPQKTSELCWEEGLCLRGYDWSLQGEQLQLVLYWEAEQRPPESYKRFLHVVDRQTGRIAAQSDDIPRDWTYPTDIWEPGEVVVDRLRLSLEGLPPGAYEVRSGWYAVDGGRPLPACPAEDCTVENAGSQTLFTFDFP